MWGRYDFVRRGITAGVVGAAVLALWFVVTDTVGGEPLRAPKFVAGVLFDLNPNETGFSQLAMYTVLHFLAFIAVGVSVAWFLDRTGTHPHFLLGIVLGFLLFDLVFYAGVVITGVNVVRALGWPEVLVGNVLAGLALVGYLHLTSGRVVSWRRTLRDQPVLREGLIAGLLGATAVALWFFLIDALEGRPLFTPAALGSALFAGASGAAEVQTTSAMVGGYTLLHIAAFLLTGFIAAVLLAHAEKDPPILLGLALLFVTFEVLMLGLLAIMANWLLDVLQWWSILLANLIAAAAMGVYLWRRHPKLRADLARPLEEESYV